jgi:anti-sigma factor RsiW
MTMIEQRTLELINADLDGELDAGERAELQRRLDSDPEARNMSEQLARIAGSLGRLQPEAPPAGLQGQILQAIQPTAKVLPFRSRTPQYVRYTMALAAGIAIAVVGIQFSGMSGASLEADQVVGTIGRQAVTPSPMVSQIALQAAGLKGSVGLSPDQGGWQLVFDIASDQPVTVTATYADTAFSLNAYAPENAGAGTVSATPGRIQFVSKGAQRQVLVLAPGAGGLVRITIEGQGTLLQEAVLAVPGQTPTQ